ncbi:hypothetical protein GLOIN_2v1877762 [Rhizophagus clarus]|uniref:Uncharacterized protein n=1 Tax=Rhizophagus clarus TaxID=94130 RepID=A0A8H3R0R7_9GLOM|nr:hypothetical protein GLOIN_2v1877762 [Rhizophagus clarus]
MQPYKNDDIKNFVILFNVILSHSSEESRNNMKNQGIKFFTEIYEQPLFNYISFWKHLDLNFLEFIMSVCVKDKSKIPIIRNEMLNLFDINTKFISLSIQSIPRLSYLMTGNKYCFSKLEYFSCCSNTNSNFLEGLGSINTSIKKLKFDIMAHINNFGIARLIEVQKSLKEVNFFYKYKYINNELYHKTLEESLIKCGDTIQCLRIDWKPITKFLSYLVNLINLEITNSCYDYTNWSTLENVSLPLLRILKTHQVPSLTLASLIKNTKGNLIEINVNYQDIDDGMVTQAIYQNCPNLCYLKLSTININTLDFENLLINCQFLVGLHVVGMFGGNIEWDKLLEILAKFSPTSLFKFKFSSLASKTLKLFLENWKGRHPMLLQIISRDAEQKQRFRLQQQLGSLFQLYKEKGIIKKYDFEYCEEIHYEDFEWIQKRNSEGMRE